MTEQEFQFAQLVSGVVWWLLLAGAIASFAKFSWLSKHKIRILKWWAPAFFWIFGVSWSFLYFVGNWRAPFPPFWIAAILALIQAIAIAFLAWGAQAASDKFKLKSWVQVCIAIFVYFPLSCVICIQLFRWLIK